MGKQVAVDSSIFNLMGPEDQRPHYLKSLIISAIREEAHSVADVITEGYKNGPGIRIRNFYNWAKKNEEFQEQLGITSGELKVPVEVDMEALAAQLPQVPGRGYQIESVLIGEADILHWAQQWVAEHYPDLYHTDWECDHDPETNMVTITFEDGTTEEFEAHFYDPDGRYLYVSYTPYQENMAGLVQEGEWEVLPQGQNFPVLNHWLELEREFETLEMELSYTTLTEVTYSDGRPKQMASSTRKNKRRYNVFDAKYEKEEYQGQDTEIDGIYSRKLIRHHRIRPRIETQRTVHETSEEIEDGVIKTTKTTITEQVLVVERSVKVDVQPIYHKIWLPLEILIYKQGSGNEVLDSFFEMTASAGGFYPTIPFRYNNVPIAGKPYRWKIRMPFNYPPHLRNLYIRFAANKEAAQNENNISWGEFVDYADGGYIIVQEPEGSSQYRNGKLPGILNRSERPVVFIQHPDTPNDWRELPEKPIPIIPPTVDAYKLCKKAFRKAFDADYEEVLQKINSHKNVRDIDYASVVFGVPLNTKENASKKYIYKFLQYLMNHQVDKKAVARAKAQWDQAKAAWDKWLAWKERQKNSPYSSRWEDPEPPLPDFPDFNFRIKLSVRSIHKDFKTVNFRNHYEWSLITEEQGTGILKEGKKKGDLWFEKVDVPEEVMKTYRGGTLYRHLVGTNVVALCWQETANHWRKITVHNFVHKNQIYGSKSVITRAVDAIDDDETSGFIILLHEDVYHSLSLVDRTQMATACAYLVFNFYEIYETSWWEDWGPIVLIVAFVVIAVVVTVATGGAGIGLLGSAEAVGGFLGLTGTAALIVGSAVNALAALLVGFILTEGSVLVFGEKWGRIVGTIITAILTIGISAGVNSVNIIDAFTKPENLIKISQATTDAYNSYVESTLVEINELTQEMWDEVYKEIRRYTEMMKEFSGFREIDPANVREYISELTERVEDFLSRTLLTGSDIAEIQRYLLTNFAENTISTELP